MVIGIIIGFLVGATSMIVIDRLRERINVRSFIAGIHEGESSITQSAEYCLNHVLPKLRKEDILDLPIEVLQVMYNIWNSQYCERAEKLSMEEYNNLKIMGVDLVEAISTKERSLIASAHYSMNEVDA